MKSVNVNLPVNCRFLSVVVVSISGVKRTFYTTFLLNLISLFIEANYNIFKLSKVCVQIEARRSTFQ